VLFDYGLVLSGPPAPTAWRRLQTILDSSDPVFHDAYWRHRLDYDLGTLNGLRYWRTVSSDLDRAPTENDLAALIEADVDLWTQPNQPMIDWAATLHRENIPTGILSNIGDAMETGVLQRCPWLAAFTSLTFSHRLGIAKPDARIYRHAVAALGVPAEQTLFLDDRIENVDAARAIGLNAIHYSSHEDLLRDFEHGGFTGVPRPAASTSRSA
jgi:putative hydrolase of the HAD superfamily